MVGLYSLSPVVCELYVKSSTHEHSWFIQKEKARETLYPELAPVLYQPRGKAMAESGTWGRRVADLGQDYTRRAFLEPSRLSTRTTDLIKG